MATWPCCPLRLQHVWLQESAGDMAAAPREPSFTQKTKGPRASLLRHVLCPLLWCLARCRAVSYPDELKPLSRRRRLERPATGNVPLYVTCRPRPTKRSTEVLTPLLWPWGRPALDLEPPALDCRAGDRRAIWAMSPPPLSPGWKGCSVARALRRLGGRQGRPVRDALTRHPCGDTQVVSSVS